MFSPERSGTHCGPGAPVRRPGPAPSLVPASPLPGVFSLPRPPGAGQCGRGGGGVGLGPRPGSRPFPCSAVSCEASSPFGTRAPSATQSLWGLAVSVVRSGEAPCCVPSGAHGTSAFARGCPEPGPHVAGAGGARSRARRAGGGGALAQVLTCSPAPRPPSASLPLRGPRPAWTPHRRQAAATLRGPGAGGCGKSLISFLSPV